MTRGEPVGPWLLAGLLLTTLPAAVERTRMPAHAERVARTLEREDSDPRFASVRALRRLPGIADRRAVRLVEARWNHDPRRGELRVDDVHGFGPVTVERMGRGLVARGPEPAASPTSLVLRAAADVPTPRGSPRSPHGRAGGGAEPRARDSPRAGRADSSAAVRTLGASRGHSVPPSDGSATPERR